MDLDHEHTVPFPVPDADYLAVARRSVQENIIPNFRSHKSMKKLEEFDVSPKIGLESPHKFLKDPNAPPDKNNFVLITIFLFGLVHMLPFSFFFTANEYWMYKFRNTTSESTDANDRTPMQKYFSSLTLLTVTTPGLLCTFLAILAGHKIKAKTRLFFVLFVHSCILVINSVFAKIDTDEWQRTFFGISLGSSLIMSCAMSLGGSGSMGLISKLPPLYMKAQLMGEGGAGLFSALLRLLSIVISPSATGSALLYFITGSCLMLGMTIVLYCATKTKFFRYYTRGAKEETKEQIRNFTDIMDVTKIIWPLLILPIFDMLVPHGSITNLVVSEYYGTDSVWGNTYFVTVCTYLIPAFSGLIGRGLFNGFDIELSIPVLYLICISRAGIFGTLLFFTNAKPRTHLPVLLTHDWEYALMTGLKSFTDGFMQNLIMIKVMRSVSPHRIELAMMIFMFCLGVFSAATSPIGLAASKFLLIYFANSSAAARGSVQENIISNFRSHKSMEKCEEVSPKIDLESPQKFLKNPNAPPDKNNFVLVTIFLFGLVHILPFSFFFNANEYWMYKFRNTTSESTDANDRTPMQRYFFSLTLLTVTTPSLLCTFLAIFAGHKIKAKTRLFSVLFIHLCILIINSIFAKIDTDEWQRTFFGISLGCSLLMSSAMSFGGSGSMGLISKLPPTYMRAQLMGEGGAGLFSALLRLLSIVISPSATGSALLYFITGSCLMLGMIIVFYCATKTKFFRYYTRGAKEETKEKIRNFTDIKDVTKIIWPLLILPLFGMLIPINSITSLVVSEYYGTDSVWGNTYFVTVCTYLIPAFFGVLGQGIFNSFDIELSVPVLYLISISCAGIFGTLLFFTNAKPRTHLPVLLTHDWEYALWAALQSFTDGFMTNLFMIKVMRSVSPNRIELAMMIFMFCVRLFLAITSSIGLAAVKLL